ncbi:MAG TPA: TolC family protein [Verrucomicrobiae bacterium]|jgi:outer membrane protein|nr:TolC family protein [Verrucomicrobiae bacterium]
MKRTLLALSLSIAVTGKIFAEDSTNTLPVLTLADAQSLALKNHPQIASANYLVLAAQEVVKETRAGYFPTINLYGTAVGVNQEGTRILAGGLNNPSVYDRAAGGLQVSQLITDFGHTANLTASSKLQAQAQDQNLEETREQVLLQVDSGYFTALGAQAVLHVAQQTLATRQLLGDQVAALATNALRSQLDVSFAQVQLQQARLLIEKAQNDADAAMATLSTALGFREFREFQLVEQPSPTNAAATNDVSDLVQSALSHRPELLSLRDQRDAALRFAKAQRDARLPVIQAVGVAGDAPIRDNALPNDYAAGGLQLTLPLFAGGLYTARQHEAELRAQSDTEQMRSLEDNIIRDVRIGWLNLNNAQQQLQTTEELVRNAGEAFELAQARYKNGISSIVELSEAQLNLTSAQIANVGARYNVLIQQANLNYQTGGLR